MSFYRIGAGDDPERKPKGDSVITFVILGVIAVLIFGLSPGARHFYKHGKLPPG